MVAVTPRFALNFCPKIDFPADFVVTHLRLRAKVAAAIRTRSHAAPRSALARRLANGRRPWSSSVIIMIMITIIVLL